MFRRLFVQSVIVKVALAAAVVACFAAVATHKISQKGKAFSQPSLTVNKGESITFVNDDDVTHNVYSTSQGNAFNLKTQAPGSTSSATFSTPGTVEVRCAIHPTMRMTVNVK